jgi:Uma2 family endonuclease
MGDRHQEYMLVSQTRKRVECFRKNNAEGQWVLYSSSLTRITWKRSPSLR